MLTLNTKIERLPSVGPSLKKTLNNLGIFYISDLFFHLPFRYIDFSKKVAIGKAEVGQMGTFSGVLLDVKARRSFRSRMSFAEAMLEDETGQMKLIWFNQPYLAKQIHDGDNIIVAGKVEYYKTNQLTNPYFELGNTDDTSGKIIPIYRLTAGITNLRLLKLIKLAWENIQPKFSDLLSNQILKTFSLPSKTQAITTLHFPADSREINQARLMIAVEDILPQQLAAQIKQTKLENSKSPKIETDLDYIKQFLKQLPFDLTASQKRATWDILQDLASGKPSNRLLEGDVGSGKTMVALIASLMTAKNSFQTLILAPTEILAKQHFETFKKYSRELKTQVALYTAGFSELGEQHLDKVQLLTEISSGAAKIIIGTHALFKETLDVKKVGLIIVDEQHRFGVGQRAFLGKHHSNDLTAHLLSMSATPIPRTLALSLFGNLKISQLKSLPSNRKPIITKLLSEDNRNIAYQKITNEITAGHQVFIITPKVEQTENSVKSVKAEFTRLQKLFPKLKIGLVYGGMKSVEKDEAMNNFANKELDILVATTVVEIGVDIPNATVILIEGAENFGLAQLHQLRGRVGRGEFQSYCYLFTTDDNHLEIDRLQIFEKTTDGFILAEHDLNQRGFGDLFGNEQSGFNFKYPKFITTDALKLSHNIAKQVLKSDPNLTNHKELQELSGKYLENIHLE